MHTGERELNIEFSKVLRVMRSDWRIYGEKEGKILKSGKKPDILIRQNGSMSVIIETEYLPASTLENDIKNKLGRETIWHEKINAVIGIKFPQKLQKYESEQLQNELKCLHAVEYVIYAPKRFPHDGWLKGNLADIVSIIQIISINSEQINNSVLELFNSINHIADIISNSEINIQQRISSLLYQNQTTQTWRMAGLILSNAYIFQYHLLPLDRISRDPFHVLTAWEKILQTNYLAIFKIAKNILSCLKNKQASDIVIELERMHHSMQKTGIVHSTDMYGSLIQKMIEKRKTLASFYTRSESATLLAGMVAPPSDSTHYNNIKSISNISIADFACGTGTLLSTLYRILIRNYEINGNDSKKIHAKMVEDNIYGFDVLPIAAHLTASSLADIYPKIEFKNANIAAVYFGKYNEIVHLGSLDLIANETTLTQAGVLITNDKEIPYITGYHNKQFDIIIMNPPFTSNTREGGREGLAIYSSFSIDKNIQKEMSKHEKNIFKDTCADGNAGEASHFIAIADKRLKPGGTLGLVLPSTVAKGAAWQKVRSLLKQNYDDFVMISIAGPKTTDGSFSFDTNMNEVLLIAKK